MVLDDGRIVPFQKTEYVSLLTGLPTTSKAEFDSPKALLRKTDGFLKSLVDENLKDGL